LKRVDVQRMDLVVNLSYILVLTLISTYMVHEGLSSSRGKSPINKPLWFRIRGFKIPPLIAVSQPDAEPISIWIVMVIGFISGFTSGFLGVGGGFILVPLLIYAVGCSPPVAAGTCIFGILISCSYASLTHTLKGNVDLLVAALIFVGSSIGVQVGALATGRVEEERFKLVFGLCVGFISLSIIVKLISSLHEIFALTLLSQIIMFSAVLSTVLLIILLSIRRSTGSER
ncbi:MAG: sulfite exporter TauE/SafE family protein, partial [Candidatus Bathyarchaeota archaeon]|nr:sulfite exporter TauE/SafE family protein [Candidatus Bathyarchaeota archaeon]